MKRRTSIAIIAALACATAGLVTSCGESGRFATVNSAPKAVADSTDCVPGNCPEMAIQLAIAGTTEGQSLVVVDQQQIDWKIAALLATPKARKVMVHAFDAPTGIVTKFQDTETLDFDNMPDPSVAGGSMIVLVRDVTRCAALTNNPAACDTPAKSLPSTLQPGEQKITFTYVKKEAGWSVEYERLRQEKLARQQTEDQKKAALQAACAARMISGGLTAILTGNILGGLGMGFLDCVKMGTFY